MLKNAEADTPKRKHCVDPPRNGIEAHRNVVNAVNGMEALLATTFPDADKPQRAAPVEMTRSDWPQWRAA
jgi:hypothetical protein